MKNSKNSPRLFFWSRAISISALLVVVLYAGYGFYLADKVDGMQQQWLTYNKNFTRISDALQELHTALGYGGLIHDFKNFVLRHNDKYNQRTETAFRNSRQALANLQRDFSDDSVFEDFKVIEHTINEYHRNYRLLSNNDWFKSTAEQRDKIVKVDDGPAFRALTHLRKSILARSKQQQFSTNNAVEQVLNLVYTGIWFVPMLIIAVVMMNLLIARLRTAYTEVQNSGLFIDNLLGNSPDALIVLNTQGTIIKTNTKASELFGYSESEFSGLSIEQLMPEKYRVGHKHLRSGFINEEYTQPVMSRPLPIRTKEGRSIICEIALSSSGNGNSKVVTASVRDVSERERTRTELKEAKYRAEVSLKQLKEAQESLVRSEKLASLGGLVAGIAHEINTPVGTTLTAATHLEDETNKVKKLYADEDLGADELEEYFDVSSEACRLITLNCNRAAELIQSFKQVAVDQTSEEKRDFELKSYIDEIILSLRPKLKNLPHQININCPDNIYLYSYPGMFSQLLNNLIINSIMHAWDEGQHGTIRLTVSNLDENHVQIIYHDNGKGIPNAHQSKIFDPFFTTKRGSGGSGLGLHILHNLVYQSLGGELHLSSEENKGTTFTIKLPKQI